MSPSHPSNRPRHTLNGGEALARMLKQHNAGPMFGMGGFQLLPFYDAVAHEGLSHSLVNDERFGAFAADAWARVSGRPGIADGTLGPGATNLVTGLVESLNAGVPMVAIAGNTNRDHSWKNMTQEARQTDIIAPAVKAVIRVERTHRIPELVRRAFHIATSGRPGPVLLDVPEDVAHGEHDFYDDEFFAEQSALTIPALRIQPDAQQLAKAAAQLQHAKRPMILAGGGIHLSAAQHTLTGFAEQFAIPVAHTLSGKGAIACTHELSLGLFGRYDRFANAVMERSDCLLVVGCKLGEIATKRYVLPPADIPVIHIDICAEEIGRCVKTDLPLWGDAQATLQALAQELSVTQNQAQAERSDYIAEIAGQKQAWLQSVQDRLTSDERPINMARFCNALNQALPAEAILVADGGFAAHWTGLLYDTKQAGRGYIANRGFASIGYGLPGSVGAQLAAPDRPVVALTGDGGFNMMIGDLETATRLGVPVTVAVVNNAASGYVKALQQALYGGHFQSSDLHELNYAGIADAYGVEGIRVEDPDALVPALQQGMANRSTPTIIDVVVTRDPAKMLPGVDNRAAKPKKGDRIA